MDVTMEPNYAELSLVELKQHAKTRNIKHYYIMKRIQLIQLLGMHELPLAMKIEKMTIHELRDEAKRKGMRGFWALRRERLVELLFPEEHIHEAASDKNKQDHCEANKHHQPEKHNPEQVGV